MNADTSDPPDGRDPLDGDVDRDMADADRANGERPPDDDDDGATNDTEAKYGDDESPT